MAGARPGARAASRCARANALIARNARGGERARGQSRAPSPSQDRAETKVARSVPPSRPLVLFALPFRIGLFPIAAHAIERLAQAAGATGLGPNPGAPDHRRLMPYVLPVATFELGHPMPLLVEMKAHHRPSHESSPSLSDLAAGGILIAAIESGVAGAAGVASVAAAAAAP